jgi:hypothetical protein
MYAYGRAASIDPAGMMCSAKSFDVSAQCRDHPSDPRAYRAPRLLAGLVLLAPTRNSG